ncbi:hypothetical protein [Streptomyces sp. NPDC001536]|uniref:hypothetical protein n=1 Tax=Streptomyces sp. NPDC001536 TaxID=3364583 RepID=UPI0036AF7532
MAALIAERHAEHRFLQHRVFSEIFDSRIAGLEFDGFDWMDEIDGDLLERAV